jgi:hypothetical protein
MKDRFDFVEVSHFLTLVWEGVVELEKAFAVVYGCE